MCKSWTNRSRVNNIPLCLNNNLSYLEIQNPNISYNCGEKCINRYMCTECVTEYCPCGEFCHNRRFQLAQNAKVYPKPTFGKVLI